MKGRRATFHGAVTRGWIVGKLLNEVKKSRSRWPAERIQPAGRIRQESRQAGRAGRARPARFSQLAGQSDWAVGWGARPDLGGPIPSEPA